MAAKKTADASLDILNQLVSVLKQNQQPVQPQKKDQFKNLTDLQKRQSVYQYKLANEKNRYTTVEIPRLYQKYLGSHLEVGHNGSTIKIPIDGRRHKIHQSFYPAIKKRLKHVDEKESRSNNYDSLTGQTGDIFEYQPR